MELKDFIRSTLEEIAQGVQAAQAGVKAVGGTVNPKGITRSGAFDSTWSPGPQIVSFHVALSESKGTETKGGIGVMLGAVGLGSQGKSENASEAVTHVEFSVPLMLPIQYE